MPARTNEGGPAIIGVLEMESNEVDAFSLDDQSLLEALAAQVTIAVENARLFTRVREEQATLEALMNGTSDAIMITDTEGRIMFFNPAAQSAFLEGEGVGTAGLFTQVVRNDALLKLWDEVSREHSYSAEIPLADGRTFYANMAQVVDVSAPFSPWSWAVLI